MASAQHHVVVFPQLAQGHTLPLLDLSRAISGFGIKVTIITTPSNAQKIQPSVSADPNIALHILPFPRASSIPKGCENTADLPSMDLFYPFLAVTRSLRRPFEDFLRNACDAGHAPLCVISDFFLEWTLDVCNLFGIPRIVFHGMGVLCMAITKAAFCDVLAMESIMDEHEPGDLPVLDLESHGLSLPFPVYWTDIPLLEEVLKDPGNPWHEVMVKTVESEENSWGVLVNSFEGLEGDYVASLESFYRHRVKAWCVGPGMLWMQANQSSVSCKTYGSCQYMEWLDGKLLEGHDQGVVYVSFGTQCHLPNEQMDEIARGLELSGKAFVWVVRSMNWVCSDVGWEERVRGSGLVVRDWVHQRAILSHPLVQGFVSHCGWNSVLESLCSGVPVLAWPMNNDQLVNAKIVAMVFRAGILLEEEEGVGGKTGAGLISKRVRELMEGEGGRLAREKAGEIKRKAREAVESGGSSHMKLCELIECSKKERHRRQNSLDSLPSKQQRSKQFQ